MTLWTSTATAEPMPEAPEPESEVRAEVDTLIDRPDLGHGCHTLIRAGDRIPRGLLGLPRRPVALPRATKRLHADRETRG